MNKMNDINIFQPIYDKIGFTNLKIKLDYYELRKWHFHTCVIIDTFKTLKAAKKFYKEHFERGEIKGLYYIELIHVKPLKK